MRNSPALDWLYGVQTFGVKLGLDNTRRLFDALELDTSGVKVLHVAGTNGKGSICAYVESIARSMGFRTGLYTSPHLVSFRERFRFNFRPADENLLESELERLRELVENWDPHPTFFELTTALAVKIFLDAKVDVIVLETGLGGRLDATNVVDADVAVIAQVDMDHQQHLGDTIEQIAAEKAGIIKPGRLVLTANQPSSVMGVIHRRAEEVGAAVQVVDRAWEGPVGLSGAHQRWNAAIAASAAKVLFDAPDRAIRDGLEATTWPARFHILQSEGGNTIVVDGAHNPSASRQLARTWRERFGDRRAAIVFGAVADKKPEEMIRELAPIMGALFPTTTPSARGLSANELLSRVPTENARAEDDILRAIRMAEATQLPVLVTGSLFLAGAALGLLGWSE